MTVTDPWQGRGVGTLLLQELLRQANSQDICSLHANVIADNQRAIRLARRFQARVAAHGRIVEYEFGLGGPAGDS